MNDDTFDLQDSSSLKHMAILKGFPPSNTISTGGPEPYKTRTSEFREIRTRDFISDPDPCPKLVKNQSKQYQRVHSALVVYSHNVMEELKIAPTTELMEKCLVVGRRMYDRYQFESHGAYGDYIQGHLRRLLTEKEYYLDVISQGLFC